MFFKKPMAALIAASLITVAGCSDDDDKSQKPTGPQASSSEASSSSAAAMAFNRLATFPVCQQIAADCNTDEETAAEIVAASGDGNALIYTDSPQNAIGFVDITNPAMPLAA